MVRWECVIDTSHQDMPRVQRLRERVNSFLNLNRPAEYKGYPIKLTSKPNKNMATMI